MMSIRVTKIPRRSNRNTVTNNAMQEPFNDATTLTRVAGGQSVVDIAEAQMFLKV